VWIATHLETAFESASRNRGLLGRTGLPPGHALIIAPSNMVHTFFMRFPIDLLFVARSGDVLKIRTHVPSRRIVGSLKAFAVIELAAGALQESGTRIGDRAILLPA
jgi:uncharacterized membrane protein (UPF0127 family)